MEIKHFTYKLSEDAMSSIHNSILDLKLDLSEVFKNGKTSTMLIASDNPKSLTYYIPIVDNKEFYASLLPDPTLLYELI